MLIRKLLACFALAAALACADPILTLTPSGTAAGIPGATTGWGFSLTNDTVLYLVVTGATLGGPPAGEGVFFDFIGPNFIVVGPSGTFAQGFDLGLALGVGSFSINPGAAPGTYAGTLEVTYDLLVNDPVNVGGSSPGDSYGNLFSVPASVRVEPTGLVPEPSTLWLSGGAVAALLFLRRRRLIELHRKSRLPQVREHPHHLPPDNPRE